MCKCKQSWEMDGKRCDDGEACCNLDDDPIGEWCMVEDPYCEEADWGYCRPVSMMKPGCTDYPPSWLDVEGDGCYTYSFYKFCSIDGSPGEGWDSGWGEFKSYTSDGYDAVGACCSCGGGSYTHQGYNGLSCADQAQWKDKDGDNCKAYSQNFWCTASGQAGAGWHEEWGAFEGFRNEGAIASEACCACGGGGEGQNFPSTSWDPWFGGWWVTPQPDDDIAGVAAPVGKMWEVASGPCTIDSENCALSPHYPAAYQSDEKCVIAVNTDLITPISSTAFATEWGYDVMKINAITYSGSMGPQGVKPCGAITWTADYDIQGGGWKICPEVAAIGEEVPEETLGAVLGAIVAVILLLCGGGAVGYCCYKKRSKDTDEIPMPGILGRYGQQEDEV